MRRKVFRIETTFAAKRAAAAGAAEHARPADTLKALRARPKAQDDGTQALKAELARVHDMLARIRRELGALIGDGKDRRMARTADELRASVDGMDYATQKILSAVELIDDSAKALAASLKNDYERGIAQEIQDQVVQIYEASNFQDLAGQRISNAIGIMTMVEDQIAAMFDRCVAFDAKDAPRGAVTPAGRNDLLNGPKLDDDIGHANQSDIDKLFG